MPDILKYVETPPFEFFPEIEYTPKQRQRVVPFHALKNNIVRIIHYAKNFDVKNKFMMIHIVGSVDPDKVQTCLADSGCSDRVKVIVYDYPDSYMKKYKEFCGIRRRLIQRGVYDEESDEANEFFKDEIRNMEHLLATISPDDKVFSITSETLAGMRRDLEAIREFHKLKSESQCFFKSGTMYSVENAPVTFKYENLDSMIKTYFRHGAEVCGSSDFGCSPTSIQRAVEAVNSGQNNYRLGFTLESLEKSQAVKSIRKFILKKFREKGFCYFTEIADFITSKPYGLSDNGFSVAVMTLVFSAMPDVLFYDSISDSPMSNAVAYFMRLLLKWSGMHLEHRRKDYESCAVYREYPCHTKLRALMKDLFYKEGTDLKKEWFDEKGRYIVTYSRASIEAQFSLPISVSSPEMYAMVGRHMVWYDRSLIESIVERCSGRENELKATLQEHIRKNNEHPRTEGLVRVSYGWLYEKEDAEWLLKEKAWPAPSARSESS